MSESTGSAEAERTRIMLGLLASVERNGAQSQRHLATELGIALGLVNACLKRCIKKGLLKVRQAPARRYAYYLTPRGFAEKSRLTVEYMAISFSFFRRARGDCTNALLEAKSVNLRCLALAGTSDLAEIACICALEQQMAFAAVVDAQAATATFVGVPVVKSLSDLPAGVEGIFIADLDSTQTSYEAAVRRFGADRVFVPETLGVRRLAVSEAPR